MEDFWEIFEREVRRRKNFLRWLIEGQFQLGFSPSEFPGLTPERAEELYNVNFGN